jgi:hypothetical protein
MALSSYIDYFLANKYAETFLFKNSNTLNPANDHSNLKKVDAAKLKDIKEELYRAARKKSSP